MSQQAARPDHEKGPSQREETALVHDEVAHGHEHAAQAVPVGRNELHDHFAHAHRHAARRAREEEEAAHAHDDA